MISKRNSVSIFFPCYNDRQSIGKLITDASETVRKFTKKYEVIVVDDGSTDGSRIYLNNLAKKYSYLKLIFHQQNLGYGGALRSGFKAAKNELIFYTDGDGQYDVSELSILLSLMSKDVDFINGMKMSRHDPTYRIVIGNLYSFFTRWLFWVPILDIDCDFRLIRKRVIKKLNLKCSSGAICIELVKKAQRTGAKFRQVSVHHLERRFGVSQFFRINRILITLSELLMLWLELMLIYKLLRVFKRLRLQLLPPYIYNPSHAREN
ncbi:glycosyltransferase family 2 protein [Candidatus Daviesbacteria bacterium]|nr:glycosyltransferase family 2 protein [Candidatus Daviesbacteria bacterium]